VRNLVCALVAKRAMRAHVIPADHGENVKFFLTVLQLNFENEAYVAR